jgi:hypothetical protein
MRLTLALTCVMLGPLPAMAQTLLDTVGAVGRMSSVAIGTDGRPLVAYRDETNGTLKVAHCTDAACTSATLSTIDAGGTSLALAIGSDGRGLIAYVAGGSVKAAHCNDVACTSASTAVVDGPSLALPGRLSVVIGSDSLPLIVYVRPFQPAPALGLAAAHCADAACSSAAVAMLRFVGTTGGNFDTAVARGADGLALVAWFEPNLAVPRMGHCVDVACTALTPPPPDEERTGPETFTTFYYGERPSLAIGADGRGVVAYNFTSIALGTTSHQVAHCADALCTAFDDVLVMPTVPATSTNVSLTTSPSGQPWFIRNQSGRLRLARCDDATCQTRTETCAPVGTTSVALAWGADRRPLSTFQTSGSLDLGAAHDFVPCLAPVAAGADVTAQEVGWGGFASVSLELDVPTESVATVDYTTAGGTAVEGIDYVAASGTLTFPGCCAPSQGIGIQLLSDPTDEHDEQFTVVFSNPQGVTLGDAQVAVTIQDDDPPPALAPGECAVPEGDAGTTSCAFPVTLTPPSGKAVQVAYFTVNASATAGSDYVSTSGILSFAPGLASGSVAVPVNGDTDLEPDESFDLVLTAPTNATVELGSAHGVILDDDGVSLTRGELGHGSRVTADLAAQPGPTADTDSYRLALPPYSSWEVVADQLSGDLTPGLLVEHLAADNATVLGSATPLGVGPAVALGLQNRAPTPVVSHHIRVRSTACTTDCGSDDVYRLRVYETTASVPRFNNSGGQATVLILQNTTDRVLAGSADFWSPAGVRLTTTGVSIQPRGALVIDTGTLAGLQAQSGSITVTHDGAYGALTGKAVALEPATGFSFDSPLTYKPL